MIDEPLCKRRARLLALRPHLAGGTDRKRQQLRRIARTRRDVEHLHARPHLRELQELGGVALRVHAPVLVGPDRTPDRMLAAFRGGAGVLGGRRRAAAEYEQGADAGGDCKRKNRVRTPARVEGHAWAG